MKQFKKTLSIFLAVLFVLSSAFTASATQTIEFDIDPPDSEITNAPGNFAFLTVNANNLIFHRSRPGTQGGHTPWGQLNRGDTVRVTWEDWQHNWFIFGGHIFIRVTVVSSPSQGGAHNGRTGYLATSFLSSPTSWFALN